MNAIRKMEFCHAAGEDAGLTPEKIRVPQQFFFPEVPVLTHYDIDPLPLESSRASDLIMRLFRDVCKTQDEDYVRFHCTWLE